ncbi:MAG: hypothetical protein K0Q93_822 [Nocardioidaceae bacterium]|jgi:hypothetical protein|nr:hypothetical protein [Nocardioidaceae bacterium]
MGMGMLTALAPVLGWALMMTGLAALAVAVFRATSPYGMPRPVSVWPYLLTAVVLLLAGGLLVIDSAG